MMGTEAANSKAKQLEDTAIATTSGLAKEIGGSPTTGNNRACFNRRVERTNIVVIRNQRTRSNSNPVGQQEASHSNIARDPAFTRPSVKPKGPLQWSQTRNNE